MDCCKYYCFVVEIIACFLVFKTVEQAKTVFSISSAANKNFQ